VGFATRTRWQPGDPTMEVPWPRGTQPVAALAGGFNLYDGITQHKLFGLHQVRAGAPNNLPYDLVFIGVAAVMLLAGLFLLRVASSPRAAPSRTVRNWGSG
jgi:Predicted membrane protein (DUF2243)